MKIEEEIKYRKMHERNAVRLAERYVTDKNYDQAASMYRAAAFHRALWQHLKSRGTR